MSIFRQIGQIGLIGHNGHNWYKPKCMVYGYGFTI